MHSYDKDLQLFIRGERREEGWKSPWRIDQERRRMEETALIVSAEQIEARQQKVVSRPYLVCKQCPAQISRMSKSGCCRKCGAKRVAKKKCMFCSQELRKVNTTGRCMNHKFAKEAA